MQISSVKKCILSSGGDDLVIYKFQLQPVFSPFLRFIFCPPILRLAFGDGRRVDRLRLRRKHLPIGVG